MSQEPRASGTGSSETRDGHGGKDTCAQGPGHGGPQFQGGPLTATHFLTSWPWGRCPTSPSLGFLICEMGRRPWHWASVGSDEADELTNVQGSLSTVIGRWPALRKPGHLVIVPKRALLDRAGQRARAAAFRKAAWWGPGSTSRGHRPLGLGRPLPGLDPETHSRVHFLSKGKITNHM